MRDDQGTVSFRKVRHQPHREAAGAAFDSGRPGHCGPGDGFPRDAASRGLAATGGRVDQAARSAFQRFRQPFSPCKDAMALLPQFGPFPNYCLVSVCWMLIWKAGNFDWKRSSPMDDSKIDSTTCATSPTTKTVAGCEPATCRAISPASPTSPSPSFASRGASTPSPKPTGTTLGGPRTPCASSSTRPNAEPHATATPRRLAPPPRQRSRSPGRAIRASGLLCIPLQTTQIPSSVTSPSSHSTGYRTTTTDSNQSRAHPCTEQNFTLRQGPLHRGRGSRNSPAFPGPIPTALRDHASASWVQCQRLARRLPAGT